MINIEDLKKQQAEELQKAEFTNELEEKTGIPGSVFNTIFTKKNGTVYSVCYGHGCNGGHYFDHKEYPTIKDAAKVLNLFPPTAPYKCGDEKHRSYRLSTSKDFNDTYGALEIEWVHNNIQFSFYLCIDKYEELKGLFNTGSRQITNSELSTYHPTTRYGHLDRKRTIQYYTFAGATSNDIIRYQGGHVSLMNDDMAESIVQVIKDTLK